jgi:pyruvate dehydrogenase E2 component (dihydrolipoamide acetyltransferase)
MPTTVIMPALELAQETGKVVRWLRSPGDTVKKGEPLVEIETDKVTVEIESPASGTLYDVAAKEGEVVPVGQTIALIVGTGESTASATPTVVPVRRAGEAAAAPSSSSPVKASPLARKLAEQHGVDLTLVQTSGGRIEKADVIAHVERQKSAPAVAGTARLDAASPKARRLAAERGMDIVALRGTGPGGAVLAADVLVPQVVPSRPEGERARVRGRAEERSVGTVWRIMAERMTRSWTTAPHFYLFREVNVSRLVSWRDLVTKATGARVTYTDLLVKLVAAAVSRHPAVNGSWKDGVIARNAEVNIGLAVAVEDGLIVPVIHRADTLTLPEIVARREDVVTRGQAGKLRPADIQGGGFTISNLGMYGVDAFHAIVNPPQAAILAAGRIADRVVAVNGQPAVQPTMMLTLSCDHRALDGARAAQFLGALADLIEEPLALLV